MFCRATSISKRFSFLGSSSKAGCGSSRGRILARYILRSHWSSGGKVSALRSCSFCVPVMSWQSTNRLNASTLVGSLCMLSW